MSPSLSRTIWTNPVRRRHLLYVAKRYLMSSWPIDICRKINNMPLDNLVSCWAGSACCVLLFLMCFSALNPTWHLQKTAVRALSPWKWLRFAFQVRKICSLVNVSLREEVNVGASAGCDERHAWKYQLRASSCAMVKSLIFFICEWSRRCGDARFVECLLLKWS